jgi:outer membrane protein TolC
MKKSVIGLCLVMIFLVMGLASGLLGAEQRRVVRIGIVSDGPVIRFPNLEGLFKQEIRNIATDEFDVSFPARRNLMADGTAAGVKKNLDRLLTAGDVDLVLALGTIASSEACKRRDLPKPVVAPFIIDAQMQKLPRQAGTSGVKNLTYIDSMRSINRDVMAFRQIAPFKSLAILVDRRDYEGIPEMRRIGNTIANEYTITVNTIPVGKSAADTLKHLPDGTQAVMLAPLWQMTGAEFKKLVAGLNARKLPTYSYWGREEVEQGVLMTMTAPDSLEKTARRVAVTVQDILLGERAASLDVAYPAGEKLTINMATARAIGIYPGLAVMTEAELVNETPENIQRRLTLERAVKEALRANLDLSAADRNVAAGQQRVKEARSPLLPQVHIGTEGRVIDSDTAGASFGTTPERAWSGRARGSQLIYSERAWANYSVEKHFQTSRVMQRDTVRLDIMQQTSRTYLQVLRAQSIERIQKQNLKLTRANLERARIRQSTGVAGPDEVYRWENQIANNRQAVLRAESATLDAMEALNRILNQPLMDPFVAEETSLSDPLLVVSDRLFFQLMNNTRDLRIFSHFAVQEGLSVSPELKRIDAAIEAQKRILTASRRDFWMPTFSVDAFVDQLFADGGEGQRDTNPLGLDDTSWSAGVYVNFPLFEGGRKSGALGRAREELKKLTIERQATAERIQQRILAALNLTRASYPSIGLSRDAADAARRNLKLVTDSYVQGIKSIIELLDAQNQALVADQAAANAAYDFLSDLMNVQRAMGEFVTFLPQEPRSEWYRKLNEYFKQQGVQLARVK